MRKILQNILGISHTGPQNTCCSGHLKKTTTTTTTTKETNKQELCIAHDNIQFWNMEYEILNFYFHLRFSTHQSQFRVKNFARTLGEMLHK